MVSLDKLITNLIKIGKMQWDIEEPKKNWEDKDNKPFQIKCSSAKGGNAVSRCCVIINCYLVSGYILRNLKRC